MRPFAFIWLLYAQLIQLTLAAGPSHVFELRVLYLVYRFNKKLPGAAPLLLPTSTTKFGPNPKNVGSDNGALTYREFLSRLFNDRIKVPAGLDFDINNPLADADKLQKAGFGGMLPMLHVKGVPESLWRDKTAISNLGDEWKLYGPLLQATKDNIEQARKTLGVGAIAKELAALEKLTQEIVRLRNEDMQQKRFFANELRYTWFKGDGNVFWQPISRNGKAILDRKSNIVSELRLDFMMDDTQNGNKIRELLGMGDQKPYDPRWREAFKVWCGYIGDVEGLKRDDVPGPKDATDSSLKHRNVEKDWSAMLEVLKCKK